jgi:hypothetical protein
MDWKTLYSHLSTRNWFILLLMSSISFFVMSNSLTLGIILGGLVIIVNFNILQHTVHSAFSPEGIMTGKMTVIFKYYMRLLALGVIIYMLITNGWVDPVGLAIGLSTVVISIISFGISRAWKTFSTEAT